MTFTLSTYVDQKIREAGIAIVGVSYNSKEEPHFRIDFQDATEEQQAQAYAIADDAFARQDELTAAAEADEAKKITPEKVQPLVDLLVSKGILTEEEITNL